MIHKKSRTPATAPPSNTTPLPTKTQCRIIITQSSKVALKVDNLIMRNTINNTLTKANTPKHILVLSVIYNSQGNMILIMKEGCLAVNGTQLPLINHLPSSLLSHGRKAVGKPLHLRSPLKWCDISIDTV